MKARVKATGETVEVQPIYEADEYKTDKGVYYDILEIELLNEYSPDYWTRLEHQYAGIAMQGILMNEKMMLDLHKAFGKNESMDITVSEFAIDIAHTLIQKLKSSDL